MPLNDRRNKGPFLICRSIRTSPFYNLASRLQHKQSTCCFRRILLVAINTIGVLLLFLFGSRSHSDASESHTNVAFSRVTVASLLYAGICTSSGAVVCSIDLRRYNASVCAEKFLFLYSM